MPVKNLVALMLIMIPLAGFSSELKLDKDRDIKTISLDTREVEGKLKAGVVLGYPTGITAGYRFSNFFELNGVVGSDFNHLATGISGLFTLVNISVSREIFPLSIGPALYTHFHHDEGSDKNGNDEYTKVDLLAIARIEYSFEKIPLNLFIEAGFGFEVIETWDISGSAAIGVRYIF